MGGVDGTDDLEPRLAPGTAGLPLEAPYSREAFDSMMRRSPVRWPAMRYDGDFIPPDDNTPTPASQGFSPWIHHELSERLKDYARYPQLLALMNLAAVPTDDDLRHMTLDQLRATLELAGYQSPLTKEPDD
jgi:hypothetical protein